MIFVAVGTHPDQFDRLIRRIDEIAPKLNEEIIIQRGFTKYTPINCKSFDFAPNLEEYYKKARLVISHSATSVLEFVMKYKKPIIVVPRQKKYGEHINDHQVEFALYFEKKTGARAIIDINHLDEKLLKNYRTIPKVKTTGLDKLRGYFKNLFLRLENE